MRYGRGWIPIMGATVDGIADGVKRLREEFVAAGREPSELQVQAPLRMSLGDDGPDLARSMESVPELVAAGATDIQVTLRAFCRDVADAPNVMKAIAERFAEATR